VIDRPVAFTSRMATAGGGGAATTSHVIDTAASAEHRDTFVAQVRLAHVVVVVADASRRETLDSAERIWLPDLRRIRADAHIEPVAVVIVANKIDLCHDASSGLEEFFGGLLDRNRDVESCLTCSARQMLYVSEVFELAQKAVVFPSAPLHDSSTGAMTPACTAALARCFRLLDRDKDGALNDAELNRFQVISTGADPMSFSATSPLSSEEIAAIKAKVRRDVSDGVDERDHVTLPGFLFLHHRMCQRGKCECTWRVLYAFGHTGKHLVLSESFLCPQIDVPPAPGRRYELGPAGIGFLADVFQRHDMDGDGLLSGAELASVFSTAVPPGHPWGETFPCETAHTSEAGLLTLRGFLSQFRMAALSDVRGTMRLLAMLGFDGDVREALTVVREPITSTSPAAKAAAREDALFSSSSPTATSGVPPALRSVFACYVFGSRGSGKSSLLRGLLGKPFSAAYAPTTINSSVCNAVSGDEAHLVMFEFVNDDDTVHDAETMARCDICCLVHDSHSPTSYAHALRLHMFIIQHYPWLPCVNVATKADLPAVR
jgi:Ras family protein T1